MKRTLLPALIFAFTVSLADVEIKNPGFEIGNKSHEGVGWWWFSTADSCDFDTEIFHSGERSIRLSVDDSTTQKTSSYWSRYATLMTPIQSAKPDTIYTIRCFVKSEMQEGQVGIAVSCQKKNMTMPERVPVKFLPIKGSTEWRELVYVFKTPAELTGVNLYCAVENFIGSAWFDDFSIQEGADIPAVPNTAEWDNALVLDQFILIGDAAEKREQPIAQTEIRLISAGENLMIRGTCFEPEVAKMSVSASGRDSAVFNDDCVELFLDAQRSRSSYYQFIINSAGALYDAHGKDLSWSPSELRLSVEKGEDQWRFELTIPYTAIGYGVSEAALLDKQMAFAAFRCRKNASITERSSWQIWSQAANFGNPALFPSIRVGVGTKGSRISFLTRGQADTGMRPPLAWQIADPLYEELMTAVPMHPETGTILNIAFRGSGTSVGETAFALQHGMKKHYAETDALKHEMRSVYGGMPLPPRERLHKYNQKIGAMPMIQFGGAHYSNAFRPEAPMFKHFSGAYFYPDPRVQESYAKHVKALLEENKDIIDEITLGHEGRFLYCSREYYDAIFAAYQREDPESWRQMEAQAKGEYGHGKVGFPTSHASATPLERMVFQRFMFTEYNKGIKKLAAELRRIKPDIRLISELDVDGVKPYFYEQSVGAYDLMCQQMPWGNGVNRQSVAFNCKFYNDLAETPARGGPHIEHYFVSLNPEEANEVISSVFRVGGISLQLWLHDWFGKTLGDYYGAPERLHEVVSICKHIATMRKLQFPEADTAIFYGNVNQTAAWAVTGGLGGGHEEAFTVLGPRARSWFKFLSDTQIALGRARCSAFKVIYDPGTQYLEEAIYGELVDYVKQGGTLVVADPLSFSLRTDGSKRETVALLGVTPGEEITAPGEMSFIRNSEFPLSSVSSHLTSGPARRLLLAPGTTVLAGYSDGAAAVTCHKLGAGRVITFAATPFDSSIYGSARWWSFFQNLQQDLGCAVNQDIWRFRFPMAKTPSLKRVPQEMFCLTGNSWYYEADAPVEGPNANLRFTTSFALPPDHIAENANSSKLFNRKESMTSDSLFSTRTLDGAIDPWVVAWKRGAPSSITLTFEKKITVRKVRFWVHNDIPSFEFGAVSGGVYQPAGYAVAPLSEASDVREIEMDIPPTTADTFELRFGERSKGVLYFAELELWGDP